MKMLYVEFKFVVQQILQLIFNTICIKSLDHCGVILRDLNCQKRKVDYSQAPNL